MAPAMNIARVVAEGLCTQCGTCIAMCPLGAITVEWTVGQGYTPRVAEARCTDCGICLDVCPGEGLDYTLQAWWRADNEGAPSADFLGPWRRLHFAWARDARTRYAGASGGIVTAILQGALAEGLIDGAIVCRMDPDEPLRVQPVIARTAEEIFACRGSKYNVVDTNVLLRQVMKEPGRYALVGLPCHIQGFRLARERSKLLRERIVFTVGLFCGWSSKPRATEVEALRAGLEPGELTRISYRGPGWPGPLHYETRSGEVREWDLDTYFPRFVRSNTLLRCRLCPDALAELADISVGDAWLPGFAGSPGVSDLVVRTPRGQEIIDRVAPGSLILADAQPAEIVRSQAETLHLKRVVYRGRMWLRGLARRPQPQNPGVQLMPSLRDRWQGFRDLAKEAYRPVENWRFPSRAQASSGTAILFTAIVSSAVAAFRVGKRRFHG